MDWIGLVFRGTDASAGEQVGQQRSMQVLGRDELFEWLIELCELDNGDHFTEEMNKSKIAGLPVREERETTQHFCVAATSVSCGIAGFIFFVFSSVIVPSASASCTEYPYFSITLVSHCPSSRIDYYLVLLKPTISFDFIILFLYFRSSTSRRTRPTVCFLST
ncbi:hypothetical protein MAP00_002577 [Monascus purpureus]|nr:hypothetical protein MAP00_002577 [Monascus purpureus]